MARVVVFDEETASYRVIKHLLGPQHHVEHFRHPSRAIDYVRDRSPDVIFLSVTAGEPGAMDVLGRIRYDGGGTPVVALLDRVELRNVVDAVQLGACDVVTRPFRMREVQLAITRALTRRHARPITDSRPVPEIVGMSRPMSELRDEIRRMARHDAPVVVTGESGVGKELVAGALHRLSASSGGRFEARNCGALPDTLVESELFGTERGAYTDAVTRMGAFELANDGTLFLDEIGELTAAAQVKLLRVLETGTFYRVGGTSPRRTTARFVAATNRDLRALMQRGAFREDLFYRIDVFRIAIPPLRERREDIPLLAKHFVRQLRRGGVETTASGCDGAALERLSAYDWPGNVRELRNVIWRALVDAPGDTIRASDLRFS